MNLEDLQAASEVTLPVLPPHEQLMLASLQLEASARSFFIEAKHGLYEGPEINTLLLHSRVSDAAHALAMICAVLNVSLDQIMQEHMCHFSDILALLYHIKCP
jgi:hypothetical protein